MIFGLGREYSPSIPVLEGIGVIYLELVAGEAAIYYEERAKARERKKS